MIQILYIAIGGSLGAVARYLVGQYVEGLHASLIPWGTFCVNLLGAFLIGISFVLITEKGILHPDFKFLLMVGVLGGFTTYSSFSLESFLLIEGGRFFIASLYMLVTTFCCLIGVWLGVLVTRLLLSF